MSIYNFLKLQWIKRKVMILIIISISIIHFFFASSYRDIHFKVMSILTGDHYYSSFTVMLPTEDEMTNLLISEVKNWSGVAYVNQINTQQLLKKIKKDSQQYGLDLPSLVTDSKSNLYSVKIDPFAKQEFVEAIRKKIINHFPAEHAIASPVRFAELSSGNYNKLTLFFLEYGVSLLFILLTLIIVGGNALLFNKMVGDAQILQSINRSKAQSLKNYLYFQVSVLLLSILVLMITTSSFSVLTILIWITIQSILAFVFYGLWGKSYQV